MKQTFEAAMDRVLGECLDIANQRGAEYADSWHLDNIVTTFTAMALRKFGVALTKEQLRIVLCAALVDVKDQRLASGAPYKRDTVVDGINYRAMLVDLLALYDIKPSGDADPNG